MMTKASLVNATTANRTARCIVCGAVSDDVVFRENGYEGRACACGTIYTSPVPPPSIIDPTHVGHLDDFYDLPARQKARWVRRHTAGVSLLEIGCGSGSFLSAAKRVGFRVEGVEASPPRAVLAAARTGATVHSVLLEDFDPGSVRYDVVYHTDMLSHFEDPRAALRKMASLLGQDGLLAFEVGLLGGLPRIWYRGIRDIGYPGHRWFYSEASLATLLTTSGLRVRHATRFDLSLCLALALLLRPLAALRRAMLSPKAAAPAHARAIKAAGRVPLAHRRAHSVVQNFLRYRVGALLPRIGPGYATCHCGANVRKPDHASRLLPQKARVQRCAGRSDRHDPRHDTTLAIPRPA